MSTPLTFIDIGAYCTTSVTIIIICWVGPRALCHLHSIGYAALGYAAFCAKLIIQHMYEKLSLCAYKVKLFDELWAYRKIHFIHR